MGKVTTADIDAFEVKYKCSDEEEADVLKYYDRFGGDLNKMLECVMLSSDADKERWVKDFIEPAIESGDALDYTPRLKATMGNAPTKKRGGAKKTSSGKSGSKKKPAKKKQSRAKAPRNKGSSAQDSLIAQIRGKSASGGSGFDSMMAGLEAR